MNFNRRHALIALAVVLALAGLTTFFVLRATRPDVKLAPVVIDDNVDTAPVFDDDKQRAGALAVPVPVGWRGRSVSAGNTRQVTLTEPNKKIPTVIAFLGPVSASTNDELVRLFARSRPAPGSPRPRLGDLKMNGVQATSITTVDPATQLATITVVAMVDTNALILTASGPPGSINALRGIVRATAAGTVVE